MDDPASDGWRALACAVLLRAYKDARRDGQRPQGESLAAEARAFLAGEGGRRLVGLLDLDPEVLDSVLANLPETARGQLELPGLEGGEW